MAEYHDLLEQRFRCAAAFKRADHEEAIQLLHQVQMAQSITTEFKMPRCKYQTKPAENVTLLHLAAYNGWLEIIKTSMSDFTSYKNGDSDGRTPLYYAAAAGNYSTVDYLITVRGCDPTVKTNFGSLPLHIACLHGHLNVARYFLSRQICDPQTRGQNGFTPLHYASQGGHLNIIKYLIIELECDPKALDKYCCLPLHYACLDGHLNVTKYFISEHNLDPNCRARYNRFTPLHCATQSGHLDIIQYLTSLQHCDTSAVDLLGNTVLHWASFHGHTHIIDWFLLNGNVDILTKNVIGYTCVDTAGYIKNRYELLNLIEPFVESTKSYPIHTFSKTILTGNSGAGKTTLASVITERAKTYFNWFRFGYVEQVEPNSPGIILSHIESWEAGKMVLYDLAGQPEYHSSHSAVMETVMQRSPATFINVVDLSNTDDEIVKWLHYWLNFIDNSTSETQNKSCVIIVGSHADLINKEHLQIKLALIKKVAQRRIKNQEFVGIAIMDCRKIQSSPTQELISFLYKSHKAIVARSPSISYYCHLLYAFLQSKPETSTVCRLKNINSSIDSQSPIPPDERMLIELLTVLSDKGMIIFLKNQEQMENSWIVVDTIALLKNVDGVLFSLKDENNDKIASKTGIIMSSSLKKLFPQYDLEMLVGFLQTLEFCHRVNLSDVTTNLQSTEACGDEDYLLFFPGFVDTCRPEILLGTGSRFGWCLRSQDPEHQFFTNRFLHVLLLRLAYTFCLPKNTKSTHHHRRCTVWTNGISWDDKEGIRTIVEVIDNRCVVVIMSYGTYSRPIECKKHRSAVIRQVLDVKKQLCNNVETNENLISHYVLKNWSATDKISLQDCDLFPIENVAEAMFHRSPYILSRTYRRSDDDFCTEKVLDLEPYYRISSSSVDELMDCTRDDEPVSDKLLYEVQTSCQLHQLEPQTHSCLRKLLDGLSLFAGRNPIIVANLEGNLPTQKSPEVIAEDSQGLNCNFDLSSLPEGQLHVDDHLCMLMVALKSTVKWFDLGLHLGLRHTTLEAIEIERRERVDECMREMLVSWLQRGTNTTKQDLISALKKILINQHEL